MCGLAALARFGASPEAPPEHLLRRMAGLVAHRGPDGTDLLTGGAVGMAFTRLSLVDPAARSQPLVSADGSLVVIANGEIYNHRGLLDAMPGVTVPGGSDCEVLLPLYQRDGLHFLDRVHGMFALVLWDRRAQTLVLARDRFGIKPLYYHRDAQRIAAASEIKALLACPGVPARLDWQASLANPYLSLSPAIGDYRPGTWFEDIELVPAATIVRIDLRTGETREHRYWSMPDAAPDLDADDDDVVGSYRELLVDSITDCATADAELGVFLSGGVDSAVVTAVAKEVAPALHTFTVLSASTYRNGDADSAAAVAEKLGVGHHRAVFPPDRVPGVAEWQRLLWLLETPMCGPEQFYKHELHRLAKQLRPELRGMLLGAAADEFAGGYSVTYSGGRGWADFESTLRAMVETDRADRSAGLRSWSDVGGESLLRGDAAGDVYGAYLRWEWTKVQQYNCWQEDRTAAGSGIEARVPFLDHRLVELTARIPAARRGCLLWDKRLIRAAAAPLLPKEIAEREKVPFFDGRGRRFTYATFARMLLQDDAALVEHAVAAPGFADVFDVDRVRRAATGLSDQPDPVTVELLLRAVNLGLLADMSRQLPPSPLESRAQLGPVPERPVAPSVSPAELGCPQLTVDSVLGWAPGVSVLRDPEDAESYVVAVDGELRFGVDTDTPDWLEIVRLVDGRRPVREFRPGTPEDYLPLLEDAVDQSLMVETAP